MENKRCQICDKKAFTDGVSVPLVSQTESGKVIDIFSNKEQALNVMIPLCPYHFVWASRGFVAVVNEGKNKGSVIFPNHEKVQLMETYSDEELKKAIKEHEGLEDYSKSIVLTKAIIEGRAFELNFLKGLGKNK